MSVNGNGRGDEIWGAARLVAPAVVALVLAGVALPLILESGTARLPAVGVSVDTGPRSALAPVEKIVVRTPSESSDGAQHQTNQSAASTTTAHTSKAAATTGSSSLVSRQAAASPIVHPAQRAATPPKAVTKPSAGSQTPQATPKPPASTAGPGNEGDHGTQSQSSTSHPGRALGHQKHEFFGKAASEKGGPPWGRALGHRDHVPPGWAHARAHGESPRGHGGDEQGQNSQGDDTDQGDQHEHSSPGHGIGSQRAGWHGRGHGH